ncbi:MAG: GerMN domain-containing protein [Ilumatobacteraceae bacterium]
MTVEGPSRRRLVVSTVAAIGLVLGAACGTGGDGAFERIDGDELFGLDQTTTTSTSSTSSTTTTTSVPESSVPIQTSTSAPSTTIATEPIELYFVSGNQLEPVTRSLSRDPSANRVMALLEEGPPPGEPGVGLRSFVDSGLITAVREPGAGFATVDLAGEPFDDIEGRDQRLAIGQIVLTLTRRPGIGQVQFSLAGEPLAVPGADGVQTEPGAQVSRVDYEDLLGDPGPEDSQPESTVDITEPTEPPPTVSATEPPPTVSETTSVTTQPATPST